jgi:hypothetical protein
MITTVRNYFSGYEDPLLSLHSGNKFGRKSVLGRHSKKLEIE